MPRPRKPSDWKQVRRSVSVSPAVSAALDAEAERRGWTVSAVVEALVERAGLVERRVVVQQPEPAASVVQDLRVVRAREEVVPRFRRPARVVRPGA